MARYDQKSGAKMENYIIRIYRRENENRPKVLGVVEIVDNGEKKPFTDFDQLKAILCLEDRKGEES